MRPIIHNITIDMDRPTRYNNIVIKKGDTRGRRLIFAIIINGKRITADEICSVAIKLAKEKDAIVHTMAEMDGESIYYDITKEITSTSGELELELEIIGENGTVLYSPTQYITVSSNVYDTKDIVSERDFGGIQAYVSAAYSILKEVQLIEAQFGMTYGTFDELLKDLEASKGDYITFLADLEKKVQEGCFNGERGPQGEKGADGVVVDGFGIIGFQIKDGQLICYYYDADPPPLVMDEHGCLIYEMEENNENN